MSRKNRAKFRAVPSESDVKINGAQRAHLEENKWTNSKKHKPGSSANGPEDAPPAKRVKVSEKKKTKPATDRKLPAAPKPRTVPVVKCDMPASDGVSESDSDEEDYISKFFAAASVAKNGPTARKKKGDKKPTKVVDGWLEEENDCKLTCEMGNNASVKQQSSFKVSKKATSPSTVGKVVAYRRKQPNAVSLDVMDDDDEEDEYEEEEDEDMDEMDMVEEEEEDGEEEEEYDSESNDYYYESDEFSDDSDDYEYDSESSEEDEDDCYKYMSGHPYDSDDDEDYLPSDEEDIGCNDVVIPHGAAVMHELNDDTIHFDDSLAIQIIELPPDYGVEKETESKMVAGEESSPVDEASVKDAEVEQSPMDVDDEQEENDPVPEEEATINEQDPEDEAVVDEACPPLVAPSAPLATYTFFNATDLRMSVAVLKDPIYVYGHLSVQALFGKVEIMGYQLSTAEKRTVYAAGGYNALNITPIPDPEAFNRSVFERILDRLKPHFIENDMAQVAASFNPDDSALVLLRADNFDARDAVVPALAKLLPDFFPTTLPLNPKSTFRSTEALLEIAMVVPGQKATRIGPQFQHNPAWDEIEFTATTRLMVMGGKGSGKSTLCQYLINRHLKQFGRILLLDLDIGQPLVFVPETLGVCVVDEPILGVGYFANVKHHKAHLFGSVNVVSSPHVYMQNVRSLVRYCNETPELRNIPCIINTMGYVSGFGEELTAALVRIVQPTALLQLTISKSFKQSGGLHKPQNYAIQLTPEVVNAFRFNILKEEVDHQPNPVEYTFHPIDVLYEPSNVAFLPPKRRTIAILVQLVKLLGDSCDSFTDFKPHSAELNDLGILITRDEYRPPKEQLRYLLDATLVYLCEQLANGLYCCHGVGIVRKVDKEPENVYLLHSLTQEQMAKTNVLAICNTSLPSQVLLQQDLKIECIIPYLQNMPSGEQKS